MAINNPNLGGAPAPTPRMAGEPVPHFNMPPGIHIPAPGSAPAGPVGYEPPPRINMPPGMVIPDPAQQPQYPPEPPPRVNALPGAAPASSQVVPTFLGASAAAMSAVLPPPGPPAQQQPVTIELDDPTPVQAVKLELNPFMTLSKRDKTGTLEGGQGTRPTDGRIYPKYPYRPASTSHPIYQTAKVVNLPDRHGYVIPAFVDLRPFCPKEISDSIETGEASLTFRETLYNLSAEKPLPGRLRHLGGSYCLADEFENLCTHGCAPAEFLGEGAAEVIAARPFRLGEVIVVDWANPDAVKLLLSLKKPVAIGFTVYESFDDGPGLDRLLKLPTSDEPIMGGWAMLVVGFEARGWIVRNSRGSSWGGKGYAIMPYGYEATWFDAFTA